MYRSLFINWPLTNLKLESAKPDTIKDYTLIGVDSQHTCTSGYLQHCTCACMYQIDMHMYSMYMHVIGLGTCTYHVSGTRKAHYHLATKIPKD